MIYQIKCPVCASSFVNGTIICPNDGTDLYPTPIAPPHVEEPRAIVCVPQLESTLEIIVEDFDLKPAQRPKFIFPLATVGEPPLRIGRRDLKPTPPIVPEVDLTEWLVHDRGPAVEGVLSGYGHSTIGLGYPSLKHPYMSRIQCVLERRYNELVLRTMSANVPTYHRRTGESEARPIAIDEYVELHDYDMVYLNNPHSTHTTLRIRILHP